jgi:hypothetical protein
VRGGRDTAGAATGRFIEEMIKAGVLLAAEGLDDPGRGVVVDFSGEAPGSRMHGETYQTAFASDDPLLRHVRTRVRSPQTNGVIERFFGTLKYEHLYRAPIDRGGALAMRPPASATSTTASDPTSRSVIGHRARPTPPGG